MKQQTFYRVKSDNIEGVLTAEAYAEARLHMSTGDFHTHKARPLKRAPKNERIYDLYDLFPEQQFNTLEKIIEAYQDDAASAEEYATSEESPLAEYVESFCYGETPADYLINDSELTDELKQRLLIYFKRHGHKATLDLLASVCTLTTQGIYLCDGEVCSATIGEQEHQPREGLPEAFKALSPEDQEQVRRRCDAYISKSGWIYTSDDYTRFVMVADEEKLSRKLSRLGVKKGASHE